MSAFPILLALLSIGPSLPSPTASQLSIILEPFHVLASFLASTHISYDLIASLLIVPTYLTFSHRSPNTPWPAKLSTLLVLLNTYAALRILLHPPRNIFSSIPFSASPNDIQAIFAQAQNEHDRAPRFDELLKRLANMDVRKDYIRYGHETMMNTPSLGSSTLIFMTYIALQLPSYVLTAFVLAIIVSLPSPPAPGFNPTTQPTSPSPPRRSLLKSLKSTLTSSTTFKAWLMITLLALFGFELYWTTNTRFEATQKPSFFSSKSKGSLEIQPPIYEIARTMRSCVILLLPVGVHCIVFGAFLPFSSNSGAERQQQQQQSQQTRPTMTTFRMIDSTAQSLNNANRKLHHLQTLQRVALTEPKISAKWMESAQRSHQTHTALFTSPTLQKAAAAHGMDYANLNAGSGSGSGVNTDANANGENAFNLGLRQTAKGFEDDLRALLEQFAGKDLSSGGAGASTGEASNPGSGGAEVR